MTRLPDSYVDSMPADESLLFELGRVSWAAARLHATVRDAINALRGEPSDVPFGVTLGSAVSELETLARKVGRSDLIHWTTTSGRPAVARRNAVIHAVTYTADDGLQAIRTRDHSAPGRFRNPELREVTLELVAASSTLPR